MIFHLFGIVVLAEFARAGIVTSYSAGGLGLGGLGGGISLGGLGGDDGLGHGSVVIGGIGHVEEKVIDYHTPAKYEFKYGVSDPKTGDKKEQSEVRVGDVVKGEYSVAEPDGTIRVVKYTADKHNGFNAVVTRIGHAVHPVVVHKTIPIATHDIGYGFGGIHGY